MSNNKKNKELIEEYFKTHETGTVYDVVQYIKNKPTKSNVGGRDKRSRIPSTHTLSQLLKCAGLKISHYARVCEGEVAVYSSSKKRTASADTIQELASP